MKKNSQKTHLFNELRSIGGKVVVLTVAIILLCTTVGSANLQNPKYTIAQDAQGRSIVWDATINFNNPTGQNDYVVFGEAPDANDGPPADIYDVAKPPAPMPPYIRACLKDNLPVPFNNLWRDYRHYPGVTKTWNLTVQWYPEDESSPTNITISWVVSQVDASEYTSVNLCTNAGAVLKNMLIDNTYTFTCPALAIQNFKIICSGAGNQPPVFGMPTPANGSTNNPLGLTWSIPINDPEGNLFSWTIQCNNGQSTSGTGTSNGTKSLSLSGLAYLTTYKVWVNATDPDGSGIYTRKWYTFTTKTNLPPVFGTPSPANGSINNPLSFTWSIPINDPEGDQFSWAIQCSNGQVNSGTGATNGTKTLSLSGLGYSKTYKIWVNATDSTGSGLYTRKWYTLTTQQQQNVPPNKPNKPSGQTNGKINVVYTYTTSTTDSNGDQVFYQWNWGDGTTSGWLGPYNSGVTINTTHKWTVKGSYSIKVKAKDIYGVESNWSESLPVTMPVSQNYRAYEFGAFFHLIIRFLRGEFADMTFIQILRTEGWIC